MMASASAIAAGTQYISVRLIMPFENHVFKGHYHILLIRSHTHLQLIEAHNMNPAPTSKGLFISTSYVPAVKAVLLRLSWSTCPAKQAPYAEAVGIEKSLYRNAAQRQPILWF